MALSQAARLIEKAREIAGDKEGVPPLCGAVAVITAFELGVIREQFLTTMGSLYDQITRAVYTLEPDQVN